MAAEHIVVFRRWHDRRFGKAVSQQIGKGLPRRTAINRAAERSPKLCKLKKQPE